MKENSMSYYETLVALIRLVCGFQPTWAVDVQMNGDVNVTGDVNELRRSGSFTSH